MCDQDQDGDGLYHNVEFSELPSARKWGLSIPLASFKAPVDKAKKLPRKLKKKLKKQAYSIAITELQSPGFATHNHLLAWSHLVENQRQRAADMCSAIRLELDEALSVNMPGALDAEAIAKVLADTLASLAPYVKDTKDIDVQQDKDDPSVYHFTYEMRVQAPPLYKVTLTKPDDVSAETWNAWTGAMRTEIDLINAQNAAPPKLSAAEEAEEAIPRG